MTSTRDLTVAHKMWLHMLQTEVHRTLDSDRARGRNLFMDFQDADLLTEKNLLKVLSIHPHSPEVASLLWEHLRGTHLPQTGVQDFERLLEKLRTSLKDHRAITEGVCWEVYPLRAVIQLVGMLVDALQREGHLKEALAWAEWGEAASHAYDGAGLRYTSLTLALKLRRKTSATKMLGKLKDDTSLLGVWLKALHHVVFHPEVYQTLLFGPMSLHPVPFTEDHRPLIDALEKAPLVLYCLLEPKLLPAPPLEGYLPGGLSEAMHAAPELLGILSPEACRKLAFSYSHFQGKIAVKARSERD